MPHGITACCRFGPYFVSPVIAGLDEKTNEPFICGMDTIGAIETAKDFMVAGTAPGLAVRHVREHVAA